MYKNKFYVFHLPSHSNSHNTNTQTNVYTNVREVKSRKITPPQSRRQQHQQQQPCTYIILGHTPAYTHFNFDENRHAACQKAKIKKEMKRDNNNIVCLCVRVCVQMNNMPSLYMGNPALF